MADLYSTDTVNAVLADLTVPKSAILDRYFAAVQTEESEEIHFDQADGARKLAPFVSPVVEGKIVQERGFSTRTFKPAYVKPKTPLDPNRPLRRFMGEQIGGSLSPSQRRMLILGMTLRDHVQMIRNRLEAMAVEALISGKATVTGEGYPTTVVDYGRDATLTLTLSGNDRWNVAHADSQPIDDLDTIATRIAKLSGGVAKDVIFEPDAWTAFRNHSTIAGRLDYSNIRDTSLDLGGAKERGLVAKGQIDGYNLFVYQDYYETDDGTVTPYLPTGTVLLPTAQLEGTQAFGAIRDEEAENAAVPWFSKSWLENDPGRRIVMTQSAPLVVPYRVNACARIQAF